MNRKHVVALGWLLVGGSVWSPVPVKAQTSTANDIDSYVRSAMAQWQVPGAAVAVVRRDSTLFVRGYGVRAVEAHSAVDENTLFYHAIHEGQFVAAVAALLVDDCRIAWDDPIKRYLPSFNRVDSWVAEHTTIRDLLGNRNSAAPSSAAFRSHFRYSPSEVVPVAHLMSVVGGAPWTALLRSRLLQPLGMNAYSLRDIWDEEDLLPCFLCARSGPPVTIERARIPNVSLGHYVSKDTVVSIAWPPPTMSSDFMAPDFVAAHSAIDAAKWLRLNLGLGAFGGRQLISSSSMGEIQTPQIVVPGGPYYGISADVSDLWSFGLQSFVGSYRGHRIVLRQTGVLSGFRSFTAFLPGADLGVAVLSNANWRGAPANFPLAVGLRIIDVYLGAPPRDWSTEYLTAAHAAQERRAEEERRRESLRTKDTTPSLPLPAFSGVYISERGDSITISYDGQALRARRSNGATATLEHWERDTFLFADDGPERYRDNFGTFTMSDSRIQGLRTTFWGEFRRVTRRPNQ